MLSLIFGWDGRHKTFPLRWTVALHRGEMNAVIPTSTSGFSVAQCQA